MKRKLTFYQTENEDGVIVSEKVENKMSSDLRVKYQEDKIFLTWEEVKKIAKLKYIVVE